MTIITIVVIAIILCLCFILVHKNSQVDVNKINRNSTSKVQSSTSINKRLNDYTISDLKETPKLSAVSMMLYGIYNLDNEQWSSQKNIFNQSQNMQIKIYGTKADYVLKSDNKFGIGYTFIDKDMDQVEFFVLNQAGKKVKVKSAKTTEVLNFINHEFTNDKLLKYMSNLTLSTVQSDASSQKDVIKQSDLSDQDLFLKVMIFYGLKNGDGLWVKYNEIIENGSTDVFYVLTDAGGNGRATFIRLGHQVVEGSDNYVGFSLPDMNHPDEGYGFGATNSQGIQATPEKILKYINDNGGRSALKNINIETKSAD